MITEKGNNVLHFHKIDIITIFRTVDERFYCL